MIPGVVTPVYRRTQHSVSLPLLNILCKSSNVGLPHLSFKVSRHCASDSVGIFIVKSQTCSQLSSQLS